MTGDPLRPPHARPRGVRAVVRRRALALAGGGAALLVLVYLLAVRTGAGQRWEESVLRGAGSSGLVSTGQALSALDLVNTGSLAVAVVVIAGVGFLRGGPALAAAAAGTVGCCAIAAELLKDTLLSRPALLPELAYRLHNSLPSGHSTVAMSVVAGLLLVLPHRWRAPVVCAPLVWAVSVGGYTVNERWHRPSDVVAANLLVLAVTGVALLFLAARGAVRRARPTRSRWWSSAVLLVAPLVLAAGAALVVLLIGAPSDGPGGDADNGVLGMALAFASSALSGLALLAAVRGVDLGRARPRADDEWSLDDPSEPARGNGVHKARGTQPVR
ncbi:phosphatase PAP2 family protein [Streptomyces sp. NPDC001941]|uniref:phosphatase PAP2 family protein n=1 Tax=Streptomyces sp. NPDC001941 TaxID=3154659 RepID=UPI00332FAA58